MSIVVKGTFRVENIMAHDRIAIVSFQNDMYLIEKYIQRVNMLVDVF